MQLNLRGPGPEDRDQEELRLMDKLNLVTPQAEVDLAKTYKVNEVGARFLLLLSQNFSITSLVHFMQKNTFFATGRHHWNLPIRVQCSTGTPIVPLWRKRPSSDQSQEL